MSVEKQLKCVFGFMLFCWLRLHGIQGLKCRSDDDVAAADMKRIVRTCMQRVSEQNYEFSGYGNGQHRSQDQMGRYDYDYDRYEDEESWPGQSYNQRADILLQRNRQHMHGHSAGGNSNGNGGSTAMGQRFNTNSNNRNHNSNKNNNNDNNSTNSSNSCITLCFFDELKMLNRDNYPDQHKVNYILTKDLRDHDLRNFYTDTIQQCFHYLDNQPRRDQCQYTRDLIGCMSEYAKANCDDWNSHDNLLFN